MRDNRTHRSDQGYLGPIKIRYALTLVETYLSNNQHEKVLVAPYNLEENKQKVGEMPIHV